jgi:putative endonuclease
MYYVYFLRSLKNSDIYIGSCENVEIRLLRHNQGKVKSTKAYRPWKLLGFEKYLTRSEAVRMEKFYKTHEQRLLLKIRFKDL